MAVESWSNFPRLHGCIAQRETPRLEVEESIVSAMGLACSRLSSCLSFFRERKLCPLIARLVPRHIFLDVIPERLPSGTSDGLTAWCLCPQFLSSCLFDFKGDFMLLFSGRLFFIGL